MFCRQLFEKSYSRTTVLGKIINKIKAEQLVSQLDPDLLSGPTLPNETKEQVMRFRRIAIPATFLLLVATVVIHFSGRKSVINPEVNKPLKASTTTVPQEAGSLSKTPTAPHGKSERLSQKEEVKFVGELENMFRDQAVHAADPESLRPVLSALNARGRAGVVSIVARLGSTPTSDQEVHLRLSLVDYLKYRVRWDKQVQDDIAKIVSDPIPQNAPPKWVAAIIADRAELLNGLAHVNWEKAADLLRSLPASKLKEVASFEVWMSLVEQGMPREAALKQVQNINPAYRG